MPSLRDRKSTLLGKGGPMRFPYRCLSLLACLAVSAPALVRGQTTGEIRGTVLDSNGAGLPGVTVDASSPSLQGTRTAVTGAGGSFQIPALAPGAYRVVFSMSGFAKAERQAQVKLDATASLAVTLQVSAAEQVVVSGEAPIVDVNTTTGGSNY